MGTSRVGCRDGGGGAVRVLGEERGVAAGWLGIDFLWGWGLGGFVVAGEEAHCCGFAGLRV